MNVITNLRVGNVHAFGWLVGIEMVNVLVFGMENL